MEKREVDSRFRQFGTVSFTGLTRVNDFIDHLKEGKIMGTRCRTCGVYFFPPRVNCCLSLDSDIEWFEINGAGTLETYSTLSYAPTGFEKDLPYTIAVVDFGTVKVFGRLDSSIPRGKIAVGMKLCVAVSKLNDTQISYHFVEA